MEEKELIRKVIELKDKKSLEVLTSKYHNLIYSIALKYFNKQGGKLGTLTIEDMFQELYIVFLESLARYDGDSGVKFITYLHKCLSLSCHRIHKKHKGVISIPEDVQDAMYRLKQFYEDNKGATFEQAEEHLKGEYFCKHKGRLKTANAALSISIISCDIGTTKNENTVPLGYEDDEIIRIETQFDLDIIRGNLTNDEKIIFDTWLETGSFKITNAKKLADQLKCKEKTVWGKSKRLRGCIGQKALV